jgi:UDP-galactopyranose mutase
MNLLEEFVMSIPVGTRMSSGQSALYASPDLICLSHLRWDFVYQRPQHLLSRAAQNRRVFFLEEPIFDSEVPRLDTSKRDGELYIAVPHLPQDCDDVTVTAMLRELTDDLLLQEHIKDYVLWYYTPMALAFTRHLQPLAVVYDCMDELSAFKGAPPAMQEREAELFGLADLVFTGGQSLYEVKCRQHSNVHAFPSSVEVAHFAQARTIHTEPEDQRQIPQPRLGFFGVIDERMNLGLLSHLADMRPDWHLVMIGPVVKINPEDLPQQKNIHYLGGKSYTELPGYLAGWDVAMMPFALNESTRFISPTKTPEYLAAGKPVISTSIRDVIRPYGELGLVRIADTAEQFVKAAEAAMAEDAKDRIPQADAFLSRLSWDRTWGQMNLKIEDAIAAKGNVGQKLQAAIGIGSAPRLAQSMAANGD